MKNKTLLWIIFASLMLLLSGCLDSGSSNGSSGSSSSNQNSEGSTSNQEESNIVSEIKISALTNEQPLYTEFQFKVIAINENGTERIVTDDSTINFSSDEHLSLNEINDGYALLSLLKEGSFAIEVEYLGFKAAKEVKVTSPVLLSIDVDKSGLLELNLGDKSSVLASGNFKGGVGLDISKNIDVKLSNESAVAEKLEDGSWVIRGSNIGTTEVTVEYGGSTKSFAIEILPAALLGIELEKQSLVMDEGEIRFLSVNGLYTDGSNKDLTGSTTWEVEDNSIVNVNMDGFSQGAVGAKSVGSTRITAWVDEYETQLDVVVNAAPLKPRSLTIQAAPNFIVKNTSDVSDLTINVASNSGEIVVDGTEVAVVLVVNGVESEKEILKTSQGAISYSIDANRDSGEIVVEASVDGTLASNKITIRISDSFSDAFSTSRSFSGSVFNGVFQAGTRFSSTIINTTNRSFDVEEFKLFNGDSVVSSTKDQDLLGRVEGGENVGLSVTLSNSRQDNGFKSVFYVRDVKSGETFEVEVDFEGVGQFTSFW